MRNILITGAASGLGRAFLEHYAQEKDKNRIFAVDISWPNNTNTNYAHHNYYYRAATNNNISYHKTDITSEADMESLVKTLESAAGVSKLDLVIHSAGIRGLVVSNNDSAASSSSSTINQSSDVAKAETLEVMTTATLLRTFEVNAVGTFQLVRHLLPFLRTSSSSPTPPPPHQQQGQGQGQGQEQNPGWSKVLIMGSRMGSISSNVSGGAYAYRASKAALNAIVKSLAIDIPDVCFVIAHPGRVATGLCNGVREDNAMEPEEVLPALVALIEEGCSLADSGRYVDRFGEDITW